MNYEPLCREQWLEYTTLLSGYILSAQGDRMLMANSVEGRFPFLDPDLVDFVNTLPGEMKLQDMNEKIPFKRGFRRYDSRHHTSSSETTLQVSRYSKFLFQ